MASRSCSRSSLHSESNSDRASPTPSHASAGSATSSTYEPPKKKPYGKYQIDLTNVPSTAKWSDVSIYVKKHTNIVDKAIAADITYISLKNGPGTVQTGTVAFQTEQMRDKAFELLNKTRELVQGRKIFVKKWFRGTPSHIRSSLHSESNRYDQASPTPSHASAASATSSTNQRPTKLYGKYHIRFTNVPKSLKWQDVLSYVQRQTDPVDMAIAGDIMFIPFKTGKGPFADCSVSFRTEQMRDQAFELLKKSKEKVEGKKLFVVKTYREPPSESTLHSESNTHSDRASPTPSHASAVSATSSTNQSPKNKPFGKYLIKLTNVSNTMMTQDLLSYVKRHTDKVDKAIAEDITFIPFKKSTGRFASIAFQTQQMRDQAFELLKRSREKVEGKKIFVIKSYQESPSESTFVSESNTHSDRASPTPSHASAASATSSTYQSPKNKPFGKYLIKLTNASKTLKWQDLLSYVKRQTDPVDKAIAEDITFCPSIKDPSVVLTRSVAFKTEQRRDQAFDLLIKSKEKLEGKKIFYIKAYKEPPSDIQSTLHSESNTHSDRASPTPSHASAVSATFSTYQSPKNRPFGKYLIRFNNMSSIMVWQDVLSYVKRQTDVVDKAIAEDITFIKKGRGFLSECYVAFHSEQMRDQAFELLKNSKEKVEGKKFFVRKDYKESPSESTFLSESNTHSDRTSPTPSHASAVSATSSTYQSPKNRPYGKYLIKLVNMSTIMVWQDVLSYVKRQTDVVDKAIADDITFVKKGRAFLSEWYVAFHSEQMRDQAFELLIKSKEKVEGKNVFVIKDYKEPPSEIQSTLHSESNTHSDRASPTPSHASAVSATSSTYQSPKNKPYGKYLIKLANAPDTLKWQDVHSYVKRHTDPVDKAIAKDITFYPSKRGPGIVPERFVAFKTQRMRDLAFELLKKSKEKLEGKDIYPIKSYRVPPSDIQSTVSNTHSDRASPTPSHASAASSTSVSYQTPSKRPYGNYHIKLLNVPNTMKSRDVLFYLKRHTDRVDRAIAEDITFVPLKRGSGFFQECSLEFKTEQMRDQAFELLKQSTAKIQGKKIFVQKSSGGFRRVANLNAPNPPEEIINSSLLIENNEDTYGLSCDYLNDIGITPPLLREIFVQFLPKDYEELNVQRLFSMAGNVMTVNLVKNNEYADAIVEYEHPIEAVQAISMFNNQDMFGTKIKCTLFNNNYTDRTFVPGPGLGPNGTPLKGIRIAIELKKITAEVLAEYKEMQDSIDELNSQVSLLHPDKTNTHETSSTQSLPLSGMEMRFQDTGPNAQHRNQQMNTRLGFQLNNSKDAKRSWSRGVDNTKFVVLFYNLPLRVTQEVLMSKVREAGEVKFVRMKIPGKALVCFSTDNDVNKCITLFNRCKVDGQIIRVKKIQF